RTDQPSRNGPCLNHSAFIELAELRYRLLDYTPSHAHAAHKPPVAVNLPVLLANRVAQVHAPSEPIAPPKKMPKVGTTCSNQPFTLPNHLIRLAPRPAHWQKSTLKCASWARCLSRAGDIGTHRCGDPHQRLSAPHPLVCEGKEGSATRCASRPKTGRPG